MINGIININKPDAITSFQVVSLVKRKLGIKRVGHLGTLDPSGCGVLPIAVGKATKLFDYFLNKRKVYRAIFCFGKETDTLDSDGVVVKEANKTITLKNINSVIHNLIGELEQLPPKYSAKSINGVRAYELARNNIEFELKPKNITVYKFVAIAELSTNTFLFEIECSAGCYIRSLCRDLAYLLGTVAYMPLIIRTNSGLFSIENSISHIELTNSEDITPYITKIEDILPYERLHLNEIETKKIKSGLKLNQIKADNLYLLFDENNEFFALGKIENNLLKMEIYFGD